MKTSINTCKSNTEPERIKDKDYRKELCNRIRNNQSKEMREFLEANLNSNK